VELCDDQCVGSPDERRISTNSGRSGFSMNLTEALGMDLKLVRVQRAANAQDWCDQCPLHG
jgi:hypothetical protein